MIATRNYISHCNTLLKDIEDKCFNNNLQLLIFSDCPAKIRKSTRYLTKVIQIPSYGWPDATIKRYELILKNSHEILGNYVAYIDADMRIEDDFVPEFVNNSRNGRMVLVAHPGYWRPKGKLRIALYSKNPTILARDIWRHLKVGGIGSWETSKDSTAFVARNKRKTYVCGGFWGGPRDLVIKMCTELEQLINIDALNGVMAIWHDESHLNAWLSRHEATICNPSFCFDSRYKNLDSLQPHISAVLKTSEMKNRLK